MKLKICPFNRNQEKINTCNVTRVLTQMPVKLPCWQDHHQGPGGKLSVSSSACVQTKEVSMFFEILVSHQAEGTQQCLQFLRNACGHPSSRLQVHALFLNFGSWPIFKVLPWRLLHILTPYKVLTAGLLPAHAYVPPQGLQNSGSSVHSTIHTSVLLKIIPTAGNSTIIRHLWLTADSESECP